MHVWHAGGLKLYAMRCAADSSWVHAGFHASCCPTPSLVLSSTTTASNLQYTTHPAPSTYFYQNLLSRTPQPSDACSAGIQCSAQQLKHTTCMCKAVCQASRLTLQRHSRKTKRTSSPHPCTHEQHGNSTALWQHDMARVPWQLRTLTAAHSPSAQHKSCRHASARRATHLATPDHRGEGPAASHRNTNQDRNKPPRRQPPTPPPAHTHTHTYPGL